jgi:hypothetical protein
MTKRDSKGKPTKLDSRGQKRPTDVNQLGKFIVDKLTASTEQEQPSRSDISRVMAALGRKGGKIGGKNRAESLTPEKRREIALKAARARWDAPTP